MSENVKSPVRVEIPVRMLHVAAMAAKEPGRYLTNCVLVESSQESTVSTVATDGRRLVIAQTNKGLFDGPGTILIPADVAKSAAKLAKAKNEAGDDEPQAEITEAGDECSITVFAGEGNAVFYWDRIDGQYPPYRAIIPDWTNSKGIARIGVTPELVAGSLKTLEKVSGMDCVRLFMPGEDNQPIGFEAHDDELGITTLAIVMPTAIDGWKVQKIKAEKKPAEYPKQASFA